MARRAQNGGSRCRRCFQTPCIREIRHSLTHIPTLQSACDPTLGVRRRRSSGKLPVIEDGVFGSRDLSQSFFYGHIRVAKCSQFSRHHTPSCLTSNITTFATELMTNGAVHFLGSRPALPLACRPSAVGERHPVNSETAQRLLVATLIIMVM